MEYKSGTLRVRTEAQKVLWDEELRGQISDGMWENSSPQDHYKQWCAAEIVVDPANVGRDFWVRRMGYRFNDKELLEVIGERMLRSVRVAKVYGADKVNALSFLYENGGKAPSYLRTQKGAYWDAVRATLAGVDFGQVMEVATNEALYSEAEMQKDLRDLRKIIKVGP